MGFIYTVTRPPLSEFVDFLWLAEGYMRPHASERVVPVGSMEPVLNLDEHCQAGESEWRISTSTSSVPWKLAPLC